MRLTWRKRGKCEAEIIGHEVNDDMKCHDVVALVYPSSSIGVGDFAAEILTHRFNYYPELVAAIEHAVRKLDNRGGPQRAIRQHLQDVLTRIKKHQMEEPK